MQVSYNKLKTFNECALKFRFAYLERLPRPPIASLGFHRRIHAALANYHFLARRDGVVREEELLQQYRESWDLIRHPEAEESKAYREGIEILHRYCQDENERKRIPAYLERQIQVPFGPYVVTGKVDRIDFADGGRYSIVDYKLDRKLPQENAAETSRQLSLYSLLVSEGLGMQVQDLRLNYLRHGVEQISIPSKPRLRETIDWIDGTANAIHKERLWAPCAGPACSTCAFHSHCPAKTGRPRQARELWQQGDLLWDMESNESQTGPDLTEITSES